MSTEEITGSETDAPFGEESGPYLTGAWAPVFEEKTVDDMPVEGKIPEDLNGIYLRIGPNPRFQPKGGYHPFDGDGMIHSAIFRNGHVTYRNKWVRTAGWLENESNNSENYWGVMSTRKGNVNRPMKDVANTDIIGHAGNAVASWYLSGDPYIVDPVSLDTIAVPDYVQAPGYGFASHPKVDERTGEMMFFDYFNEPPHMSYGVVDAEGKLVHHVPIEIPRPILPHDLGVTESYTILHDLPLCICTEAMKAGRHKLFFDSTLNTRFGVIPRYGAPESIKWFDFEPCYVYHVVNCWEEGEELVMVACRFLPSRHVDGSYDDVSTAKRIGRLFMDARLWEYRMNLKTGIGQETCLNATLNVEFPTINSAFTGRKSKWAYLVDHDPESLRWLGIRKFDVNTGENVAAWSDSPSDCWYSEPWFAPADNALGEDHGYIVVFLWNEKTRAQELQLLDAQHLELGPIARIKMPFKIPVGFHGCWMKPEQIANWQ